MIDGSAFQAPMAVEVLPFGTTVQTRDALADALVEVSELEALFDPSAEYERGLGALNRASGQGEVALDDRAVEALHRALLFCVWSENAHGPLGGALYGSWGLRQSVGAPPGRELLAQAIESAGCENLTVDRERRTATIQPGSRTDLWGFARGYAVDRAVERLRQAGARSGWVQIGSVVRAFVDDAALPGWQLVLDATAPDDEHIERIVLKNEAIAMVSSRLEDDAPRLRIVGKDWTPYLDQRSGAMPTDKAGVFVVTETAIDAWALAVALWVQNPREGQFRSGQLQPRPAVKWLLGQQTAPVESSVGWARLDKWQPRS